MDMARRTSLAASMNRNFGTNREVVVANSGTPSAPTVSQTPIILIGASTAFVALKFATSLLFASSFGRV